MYINVRGITIPSFIPRANAHGYSILVFISIVAIIYLSIVKKKMVLRGYIKDCGPSVSGKSTLIRCINRLEKHQNGRINVMGHELTENTKDVSAIRRDVGMVFQSFNLFLHLTILQNLTLGPDLAEKNVSKRSG